MAQEIIICFLFYFLLFSYEKPDASALPLGDKDSNECPNCDREMKMPKKMDEFLAREAKYVKNLSNKYMYLKNPNGFSYLLYKGWGARGMPFNVLYTPSILQQKMMMKSLPKKPEKLVKSTGDKGMPEIYDLVLEDEKPRKVSENSFMKPLTPRKYYSLIPQFFVSYGW